MREVSDEDVVREFAWPTVTVRESSRECFKSEIFEDRYRYLLQCEIKEFQDCSGRDFRDRIHTASMLGLLRATTDREWMRDLARRCGQHYMAVQYLASLYLGWSWVCYGGSSNLFAFFPVKTLLLSDAYVWPELSRKLCRARFPDETFPLINEEQDVLFKCDAEMMQKVRNFTGQK